MNKKKLFPLALVPLAATSLQAQSNVQTERTDKRPNIILFMVDDMGWQDTSLPFGHKNALQRAVRDSEHGTVGTPRNDVHPSVCQQYQFPTRCSLITRNKCGTPPA